MVHIAQVREYATNKCLIEYDLPLGRLLTEEDITHHQRIVVALQETMRLMGEIDEVIEAHGGWPIE
jgi:hypothetical protein